MFDDFNDFDKLFGKIWSNFNRPVLDQKPFKAVAVEKGYLIVVNTLGIDKNNLSVTLENEKGRAYPILKIVGETDLPKIGFKNNVNIGIIIKLDNEIKNLSYKCENGLTTVFIETEVEEPKKINKIEGKLVDGDDGSLDW